ncbi:hypothetical protein E2K93_00800 [Thalassotalea sp. HSM 43]|uniref:tetratricopeptide repeat protein n=1 Tax=Thalassotalea sp. HSM 43 TaxID=2552945 RepID=UPI001081BD4B|nr:tetratricopeptide repeat protein [Thalassotalea sp. HSM 43]QBY02996.1 hypothetical protein E2K93_00800 [Thalassotalea sp. HSM 43]
MKTFKPFKQLGIPALIVSSLFVVEASVVNQGHLFSTAHAAQSDQANKKTKRVPAMRERVYSQLARAQNTADAGDVKGGFAILDEVKERLSSLNSYERAMLFNFYGFMHYGADEVELAINNFAKVVAEKDGISDALYLSTQFSLAQLYMQQQDYSKSEQALMAWQQANTKPLSANQHILFAQIYYQQKKFSKALTAIDSAIDVQTAKAEPIKENWLVLKRAAHYELKQPKMVTEVLEDMVRLFNKPQYWLQLSGMYGEIGEEKKQLAVMEAAYHAGYIEKQDDLMTLAQLYIYHQLPFKAAVLMQNNIDDGTLLVNVRRLELLSQAYMLAKEDEKALPVLVKASEISDNGQFDAQLAQVYVNLEKWPEAIKAAEKALERGGFDNIGDMHLALGISYFNLKQFDSSLLAFKNAQRIESSAKMAKQWSNYVEREKGYQMQLAKIENHKEVIN